VALNVLAFAGGVGGAKLVHGLAQALPADQLTVIVNTGDDFEHLGLVICPDLDTVIYTLAGLADPERGWGRADETWNFLHTLQRLGGPTWFRLGDHDLALHVERTRQLKQGRSLSEVTSAICSALDVRVGVFPMSDQAVRTIVLTEVGDLPFQEYFVARRFEPRVEGFRIEGVQEARLPPLAEPALASADLVILCPSNPWVSLDPILSIPGVREAIAGKPVYGVSPIIGGKAVKGPAAKMYRELGIEPSAEAYVKHYQGLLEWVFIDREDADLAPRISELGVQVHVTNTIMKDTKGRRRLAEELLHHAQDRIAEGGNE
jgi:LPPG:FO 2-phospho-L-lactate transferase